MRPFRLSAIFMAMSALALTASGLPQPQSGDVSADDVLKTAGSAARYGSDSGNVDQGLLDELFGSGGSTGSLDSGYKPPPPEKQKVDNEYTECKHQVYASQGFQCVPYYQCDDLGEIITDGGEGLIDIRGNFGQTVQLDPDNSKCPGDLEVCCRHPDFTDAVTGPPVKTTTTTPRPQPPKYQSQCGRRNIYGVGVRIQNNVYDASTQFGEWPHMCALLAERDGKNLFVCGASLIGQDTVLTAAHCIKDYEPYELKVRCGEWDTQQRVEPKRHQDRTVESLLKHPAFNPGRLYNDVAVLKTKEPFILDQHVDIICLPDLDADYNYDPRNCFATGWGKDKFGDSGEYQVILKQVEMDLEKDNPTCEAKLRQTKLGKNFVLDDSFFCAGGEAEVDTCKGDGGGPLVCPSYSSNSDDPKYVQAGIVAWGVGCGKDGIPGVYADIKGAMCFIDWAAGCMSGRDSCPHPKCNGWLEESRRPLQDKYNAANNKLQEYTGDYSSRSYKRLQRRVKTAQATLDYFSQIESQCAVYAEPYATKAAAYTDNLCFGQSNGNDDDDDYYYEDEVDISGYQRTGAKNGEAGTRTATDDSEEADDDGENFASKKAEKEEASAAIE